MAQAITIDLQFHDHEHVVAAFLLKHSGGGLLIECGPGSTLPTLRKSLAAHGLTEQDITDVLLTHIHLDHAGAAGWFARQGARIHVHPQGAAHLLRPEKLIASATRIYGEKMDLLWGEFLPVPPDKLVVLPLDGTITVADLEFQLLDTPGHAEHHLAFVHEDLCFVGDVGGIRLPGLPHLRVPMPPPEFHLERWRDSVRKLQAQGFHRIAPTHFGIFDDAAWHLDALSRAIDEVATFLHTVMPTQPTLEQLNQRFLEWSQLRSRREGVPEDVITDYETGNPSWMSAAGMMRYWTKYHSPQA